MQNNNKICQECLYPEKHPLNLYFNADQVCSGCFIHREKNEIDWENRFLKLKSIINNFKSSVNYDCIIPVSGGKDSFFIVDFVINKLKLHPLLVTYNRFYNTEIGLKNLELIRDCFGCDIVTNTSNIFLTKKLIQASFETLGSIHWPYLAGETVFPVQCAIQYKVPLIIWGAHQGIDQVGMFSHLDEVQMTRRYRQEHDLLGFEPEDLIDKHPYFTELNLKNLFYPNDRLLAKYNITGIYLNNYIRWDSLAQHKIMQAKYKYFFQSLPGTFDKYNDVHCQAYMQVHDYIKFHKYGFGKGLDHICREIRLNKITRTEGINLLQTECNKPYINFENSKLLKWLELSEPSFNEILNKFNKTNLHPLYPDISYSPYISDESNVSEFLLMQGCGQ